MSNETNRALPESVDDESDELALIPKGFDGLTDEMMDLFGGVAPGGGWTCVVGTCNS